MDNQGIVAKASEYYKQNFKRYPNSVQARYVIEKRKFDHNTIKTFGIGFSSGNIGVIDYLYKNGYSIEDMEEYGIVSGFGDSSLVDTMSNRFTLEIKNVYGKTVSIAGRTIGNTNRYKYLNTKNSPIFVKKKTIFNLDKAKYHIDYLNNPYLILVEGYCDVMSLWQNGIKNAVALMGTACSEYHARLIKMFCNKVIICLDGDKAGQEATQRTELKLNEYGIETHQVLFPNGKDADETIQMENGREIFSELIKKSLKGAK